MLRARQLRLHRFAVAGVSFSCQRNSATREELFELDAARDVDAVDAKFRQLFDHLRVGVAILPERDRRRDARHRE